MQKYHNSRNIKRKDDNFFAQLVVTCFSVLFVFVTIGILFALNPNQNFERTSYACIPPTPIPDPCDLGCDGCSSWSGACWSELTSVIGEQQSDLGDMVLDESSEAILGGMSDLQYADLGSGFTSSEISSFFSKIRPKMTPFKDKFDEKFDELENTSAPDTSKNINYVPIADNLYVDASVGNKYIQWHISGTPEFKWSSFKTDINNNDLSAGFTNIQATGSIICNPGGGSFFVGVTGGATFDTPTGTFGGNVSIGAGFTF